MSFDLHVQAQNYGTGEQTCDMHNFNYTSNMLPAIRLATGNPDQWRNGATTPMDTFVDDCYGWLFPTWARNREAYCRLDPTNGWGSLMSLEHQLKQWLASIDPFRHDHDAVVTFLS